MEKKRSRKWLKVILPIGVLVLAIGMLRIMIAFKPQQEKNPPEVIYPKITVHEVAPGSGHIAVKSQGTVRPRQQTRLTARVSGQIEWVARQFYEGGRFEEGEVLLELDPLPYKSALAEAKSRLALAESTWLQERELAEQARIDWKSVGAGKPSPLVLREPQIAKAEADREAAKVGLEMAERNLDYTKIRAPYTGRVLNKYVDVGQSVTAQATILGDIFSTDSAEIAVPLSQDDLAFINLDGKSGSDSDKPVVHLFADIAGTTHEWTGWLDRTAAAVNEQSRMITAIVRIEAPFTSAQGMSLKPGMFVRTEIEGSVLEDALRVPRSALQPGGIVYRLTADSKLESVHLQVLRTDSEFALISGGLQEGDRLCMTPLLFFVEGMKVEVLTADNNTEKQL